MIRNKKIQVRVVKDVSRDVEKLEFFGILFFSFLFGCRSLSERIRVYIPIEFDPHLPCLLFANFTFTST